MFTGTRRFISGITTFILLLGLSGIGMAATSGQTNQTITNKQPLSLTEQVRIKLITLDNLSVFDNLVFNLEGSDTVILAGQVVRPTLKSYAASEMLRIAGIKKVVNNIEVMPLSPLDDTLRLRTYRAIYSSDGFDKYAIQAMLPIRIIVKNGNITLEGMVGSQLDKTLAETAARSVPNAFSVTDNLTIG